MITALMILFSGFIIGLFLPIIVRRILDIVGKWYTQMKVDNFLNHQIDYYKPIEKGTYPKEEDV